MRPLVLSALRFGASSLDRYTLPSSVVMRKVVGAGADGRSLVRQVVGPSGIEPELLPPQGSGLPLSHGPCGLLAGNQTPIRGLGNRCLVR